MEVALYGHELSQAPRSRLGGHHDLEVAEVFGPFSEIPIKGGFFEGGRVGFGKLAQKA